MKRLKMLILLVVIFTLTACSQVKDVVVNTVKSIDGNYTTELYGFNIDIEVSGEKITGDASMLGLSKGITGSVDLEDEEIKFDIAGEGNAIKGNYEVEDNGDLEVNIGNQTLTFEKK